MTIVWLITLALLYLTLCEIARQTDRANRAEGEADEWRRRFNEARGDLWLSRITAWREGVSNECRVIEGDFELVQVEQTPLHDEVAVRRLRRDLDRWDRGESS